MLLRTSLHFTSIPVAWDFSDTPIRDRFSHTHCSRTSIRNVKARKRNSKLHELLQLVSRVLDEHFPEQGVDRLSLNLMGGLLCLFALPPDKSPRARDFYHHGNNSTIRIPH